MYGFRDRINALKVARKLSCTLWLLGAVASYLIIVEIDWPIDSLVMVLVLTCIIISKRIGILTGRYNLPEKDVDLLLE